MSAPGYLANFDVLSDYGRPTVVCTLCDATVAFGALTAWNVADAAQRHDRVCPVTNVTR